MPGDSTDNRPNVDAKAGTHDIGLMTMDPTLLAELCERNDIQRLRVFGSVARGEETASSDIDFLADFSRRKSLLDLVRIEREFSERLGRRIDLLTEAALSPYLRERFWQSPKWCMSAPRDDSVYIGHIQIQ